MTDYIHEQQLKYLFILCAYITAQNVEATPELAWDKLDRWVKVNKKEIVESLKKGM